MAMRKSMLCAALAGGLAIGAAACSSGASSRQ